MAKAPVTLTYDEIIRRLNNADYAPVYLLHGEEGYLIDKLTERFEEIIPEADRDFNLYTFYAPETDADTIMDACRRYPMMSDRQVVIVKEAQAAKATEIERLHLYASQPTASTILVICFRGQKAKVKELAAQMAAHDGVMFESAPLKEKDAAVVIKRFITEKGLNIEGKGLGMLRDFVGADLSRIYNEVQKLTVALPAGATITPEVIEKHIGISKDYNNFELVTALATRNAKQAFTIVNYFRKDPKRNPWLVTINSVWGYFSNLFILYFVKDRTEAGFCAALGRKGSWLPTDYKEGMRNYNAWEVMRIIHEIRVTDCRSKGIDSRMDPYDLLNDLIFRIVTVKGR